jgi:hypothetical protein
MPVIGFFVKMWTIQFKILRKVVQVVVKAIGWYFKTWWKGVKLIFKGLKFVLVPVFKAWWTYVKFVFKVVGFLFGLWWKNVKWWFGMFKKIAVGAFKLWWGYVKFVFKVVSAIFTALWKVVKFTFNLIATVAKNVWWVIKGAAIVMWRKFLKPLFETIGAFIVDIWNVIKGAAIVVWDAIKAAALFVWTPIKEAAAAFRDWMLEAWDSIKTRAVAIWTPVQEAFTSAWEWIKTKASEAADWIKEKLMFWKDIGKKAKDGARDMVKNFIDGMKEKWEQLKDKIPAPLRSAGGKIAEAGKWVGSGIGKLRDIGRGADDFVYQEGGGGGPKITPINKDDVLMGSKRGGAIDNILKRLGEASPAARLTGMMKQMIQKGTSMAASATGDKKPIIINVHIGQKKIDQIVIDALDSPTGKKYLSPYAQ